MEKKYTDEDKVRVKGLWLGYLKSGSEGASEFCRVNGLVYPSWVKWLSVWRNEMQEQAAMVGWEAPEVLAAKREKVEQKGVQEARKGYQDLPEEGEVEDLSTLAASKLRLLMDDADPGIQLRASIAVANREKGRMDTSSIYATWSRRALVDRLKLLAPDAVAEHGDPK